MDTISKEIPFSRSMYMGMHGDKGKAVGNASWFHPERKF